MAIPIAPPEQAPNEVYATFSGPINENSTHRIFQAVAGASAAKVRHIHFLLESFGGFVGDGIALYNFFRTLPMDLTIYNVGSIQSIAVIAYLGAKNRKASASAAFMIHRVSMSNQTATASSLHAVAKSIAIDDQRIEAILRKHLTLKPEDWTALDHHDLHFSAEESVKAGIANEVGEWSPPVGTQIFGI
jgi:ATP-dependent Clp protease protease subunit